MSLVALLGAVELGIVYSLLALGIFISYRILNIADLTVEGSFTTGAAVSAVITAAGHPFWGMAAAAVAGALAGCITALLQTKLGVQPILAGILTMSALYSINLRIMGGRSTISLLKAQTIFSPIEGILGSKLAKLGGSLVLVLVIAAAIVLFFRTQLGMSIRATGDNEEMVRSSSINSDLTKMLALGISNGIVALSGGLAAQYQSFADISMGIGMVVVALASLIIGEAILGRKTVLNNVLAVIIGAVIYRIILTLVLSVNLSPSDMKLISASIVALAISYPAIQQKIALARRKKAGEINAAVK